MPVSCNKILSANSSLLERIALKRGLTSANYVEIACRFAWMFSEIWCFSEPHRFTHLCEKKFVDHCKISVISMFSRTAFFFTQ